VKAKRKNSSADLERDADPILSFPLEKRRDKNQQSGHQSTTTRLSLETGKDVLTAHTSKTVGTCSVTRKGEFG
jgi:hypothetical protein